MILQSLWQPSISLLPLFSNGIVALFSYVISSLMLFVSSKRKWEKEFGSRPSRLEKRAPSFGRRPPTRRASSLSLSSALQSMNSLDTILESSKNDSSECGLTDQTASMNGKDWDFFDESEEELDEPLPPSFILRQEERKAIIPSVSLDMDHLKISFWNYMFGMFFIGPNAVLLWTKGLVCLKIREFLYRIGVIKPRQGYDPKKLACKLLLETCCCPMNYVGKEGKAAIFIFEDFPMLDKFSNPVKANLFKVTIDLDKKEMIEACLDERNLSADDAVCLIWFNCFSTDHVKIHSLANWAAPEDDSTQLQSFHHRMSAISILYNYFGFKVFPRITKLIHSMGLLKNDMQGIADVFQRGCEDGVPHHANLTELSKDSYVIDFILKLRGKFLRLYSKHKDSLPRNVDSESLFVSTVLHSLDHTLMEWNLKDPLWLDYDKISSEFHVMAELGRFVRVGFVEDLPGIMFSKRFKDTNDPFFRAVYREAVKINEELADKMDTCIIK